MSTNLRSTTIGVFRDRAMARQAMEALGKAGFSNDQIRYLGSGGATDTSGGFFEGVRNLFASHDATSDNVGNDLAAMGLSDEEARYYSNEYANGHSIIAVNAQGRKQEAMNTMQQYGAYNHSMMPGSTGTANYGQQPYDRTQASGYTTPTEDTTVKQRDVARDEQPQVGQTHMTPPGQRGADTTYSDAQPQVTRPVTPPDQQVANTAASNAQPQVGQTPMTPPNQRVVDTANSDARSRVTQTPVTPPNQRVADTANSDARSRVTQTPVTPPNQQVADTANSDTRLQALQAQLQETQRQLQDAQERLQAAKAREAQLRTSREHEVQLNTMQKQLQDAQAQLQATMAELRSTEGRLGPPNQ